jgi:hypothetical protein
MKLKELALKELNLYTKNIELNRNIEQNIPVQITNEYSEIHFEYSILAQTDIEALKRGLFILWYSIAEPTFLTGIGKLDSHAENRIIRTLNTVLIENSCDYELEWMLDYYSAWDYVFQRYVGFEYFQNRLKRNSKIDLPNVIDNNKMKERGQMGIYWNSILN